MPPRIVIVDDDPTFLATVRTLLEADGFDVVGEALNGVEGVATAEELEPDLVLVDGHRYRCHIAPRDLGGLQRADRLAGRPPLRSQLTTV
jgi:DNA-binding NarL/FixJ family response regulator